MDKTDLVYSLVQEGKIYFLSRLRRFGFGTGTPTYLVRLLSRSQENLDKMTGRYYDQREFIDYKADERKRERYFQYTFYLILRLLGVYAVRAEERQSRGRVTAWWRHRTTCMCSSSSWTAQQRRHCAR